MFRKLYSLKQKVIEITHKVGMTDEVIPIYMFHHVEEMNNGEQDFISITTTGFENFIENKKKAGYVFSSIDVLEKKENFSKKYAIITFDDMYEDAYLHAIPILRKKEIPYIIFISPQLINSPGYISNEQFLDMKNDELCTIGAHSMSHSILRKLSMREKEKELDLLKHEGALECKIDIFAYPYGSCYACDLISKRIVKGMYRYGFSTLNFPLYYKYLQKRAYFIPRINVNQKNYLKV